MQSSVYQPLQTRPRCLHLDYNGDWHYRLATNGCKNDRQHGVTGGLRRIYCYGTSRSYTDVHLLMNVASSMYC